MSLPNVPPGLDHGLTTFLNQLRESLGSGNYGGSSTTSVQGVNSGRSVAGGSKYVPGGGGNPTGAPVTNSTGVKPPVVNGLETHVSLSAVMITWEFPVYGNHSVVQVFRSADNNTANAVLIGSSTHTMYVDSNIVWDSDYFYWVKAVSSEGLIGAFNAVDGIQAHTSMGPDHVLAVLNGALDRSQLAQALITELDNIDTAINGLDETYGDTTAAAVSASQAAASAATAALESADALISQIAAEAAAGQGYCTNSGGTRLPAFTDQVACLLDNGTNIWKVGAMASADNSANSASAASGSATAASDQAAASAASADSSSTSAAAAAAQAATAATSAVGAATSAQTAASSESDAILAESRSVQASIASEAAAGVGFCKSSGGDSLVAFTDSVSCLADDPTNVWADGSEVSAGNAATSASAASTSASQSAAYETGSASYAAAAETSKTASETAAANAGVSETNAASSATSASGSASNASSSETAAAASKTNAGDSAVAASTSESNAATSATNAGTSATSAEAHKVSAETAATNAGTSATAAATSASNASASETAAGSSASAADTSATTATTQASNAGASATQAASSATSAGVSESIASTSESNAATSETNAGGSATAASNSASAAATSAGDAGTSASAAETHKIVAQLAARGGYCTLFSDGSVSPTLLTEVNCLADNASNTWTPSAEDSAAASAVSASSASSSETLAGQHASAAATAKTEAETAQGAASASATQAASSATSASGSASNASASESNAATSETHAGGSATAASSSASAAATSAGDAGTSASAAETHKIVAQLAARGGYCTLFSDGSVSPTLLTEVNCLADNTSNTWTPSAEDSAAASAVSASSASSSETLAGQHASAAATAKAEAETAQGAASTSATQAASSATSASGSASNASASESNAASSKDSAGEVAAAAASSASTASTKATEASNSATAAAASETKAELLATAGYCRNIATQNLESSYTIEASCIVDPGREWIPGVAASTSAAATHADSAETAENNALTSAGAASTSATSAGTSESNALTYKNSASASATTAEGHATAAAADFTSLTARLDNAGGAGVTVEQSMTANADSIDGLEGQYSVKMNANGQAAGFGLAVHSGDALGSGSEFAIVADKLMLVDPGCWFSALITQQNTAEQWEWETVGIKHFSPHLVKSAAYTFEADLLCGPESRYIFKGFVPQTYPFQLSIHLTGTDSYGTAKTTVFDIPYGSCTRDPGNYDHYTISHLVSPSSTDVTTISTIELQVQGDFDRSFEKIYSLSAHIGGKFGVPFLIQSGVTYINSAMIQDASIVSAMIESLTADKLVVTGGLSALSSDIGTMTSGKIQNGAGTFVIDLTNGFISITA